MALLILLMLVFVVQADLTSWCPVGCYCPSILKADCSSQGFEHIPPHLHLETRVLNVSNNSVSKLGNDTFTSGSLPYLKVLYMDHNNISRIHIQSFVPLDNLRFVFLDQNNIPSVQKDIFLTNFKVETLSLRHNPLRMPPRGPFLNVPSLLDLDLSHCNLSSLFAKTFVSLRKLESLKLSHNLLRTVSKEVFMPLRSIKQLFLSHNNISNVEFNVFASMKSLLLLDLSYNKLKELSNRAFFGQSSLQVLYLSYNKLTKIGREEFYPLVNLKELYLQNNSLHFIEDNLFRTTVDLRILYLDNNLLTSLSKVTLSRLESLTHLYITRNQFQVFSFRWVCKLNNLKYLRVFGNPMWCDCDMKDLWDWAAGKEVSLWGSCVHPETRVIQNISAIPAILASMSCNFTSCDFEPVIPLADNSHLTLVYILSGVCPLLLFIVCFICAAWVFTRHRKNARELRNRQYRAPSSSTGYLILDTLPRSQQMYSSSERQESDSVDCLKAHNEPVVIENRHAFVSPYSVSHVLPIGPCSSVSSLPPPVPARPPSDLVLSTLPHCYPEGNVVRGAAFSTSEEEESRPLMKHYRTAATLSKESSVGGRQPRRIRPRRRHTHHQSASDTEPWSSHSEGSGSVSVTECEVTCWSGSEASTLPVAAAVTDAINA